MRRGRTAQALLPLLGRLRVVALLEQVGAALLDLARDVERHLGVVDVGLVVARVVLVPVGERVARDAVVAVGELAAVADQDLLGRRVALDGRLLDEADDRAPVEDATAASEVERVSLEGEGRRRRRGGAGRTRPASERAVSARAREAERERKRTHNVLAVEVRGRGAGDEELRAIGARTGVGHREEERLVVLEVEAAGGVRPSAACSWCREGQRGRTSRPRTSRRRSTCRPCRCRP